MAKEGSEASTEGEADESWIRVRGARVHNLRDLDVDIPRDRLVVLTGVSGSGKSSLAFNTLYAEGQRRYLDSLSGYARHFLDQVERPDVDAIEGLPPTVLIDQKSGASNPRSTVGTVTEIYDYLRVLYARAGIPHCPRCSQAIRRQSPEQMVSSVLAMPEGSKVILLAPLARGKKGLHADVFQAIRRAGLLRGRVDGELLEITKDDPKLNKAKAHTIEAVVDRLVIREGIRPRIAESIDLALKLGEGTILLASPNGDPKEDRAFSLHYACPACGMGLEELEPRTFSFNSPHGACRTCDGLGELSSFDRDRVVPDQSLSIAKGALAPCRDAKIKAALDGIDPTWLPDFLQKHGLKRSTPLKGWPESALSEFLEGEPHGTKRIGLFARLDQVERLAKTSRIKGVLDRYRTWSMCPECGGARIRAEARAVTVGGMTLGAITAMEISEARAFFGGLSLDGQDGLVAAPLTREIVSRLEFLQKVGLGYLSIGRGAATLSGGELQRVRLATQVGSGLVGVCYILDEPTAGLHPLDTSRLLETLQELRDRGNSLVVVEHDELTMRAADWLIDLGPGAGPEGGTIVASGRPGALVIRGESSTARFLSGEISESLGFSRPLGENQRWFAITGAKARNLRDVSARFPLGALSGVSGVSGSGKSTLILDVLVPAVRRALAGSKQISSDSGGLSGADVLDKLIVIDQAPIGRGPRTTPATFTGVFDEIRKVFARIRESKIRGYGAARFSFNVKGGRCEICEGQGVRKIVMNFLPDMEVVCEACGGLRFNAQTLEIRFKGKSIGEVLELRVDEACALFEAIPRVIIGLNALRDAGLGYVKLGQSSATLSGGESQRVKLATELARVSTGRTLFVLDEPTTGLHFQDVTQLLKVLRRIVGLGNSVIVIEHHLGVLRSCDWLIELGPGGGREGGKVVAMGTPNEIAADAKSPTGRFLRG